MSSDAAPDRASGPISADSHPVEPPGVWDRWLPRRQLDRAPKLVVAGGARVWEFAGHYGPMAIDRVACIERAALAGKIPADDVERLSACLMRGSGRAVLQRMDGVAGEVIFPNGSTAGHFLDSPDPDLVRDGVRAYNLFLTDEYCGDDPATLFPVGQMPSTGIDDCIVELRFAAAAGCCAVVLPCWPSGGDSLSDDDLPFFRLAAEMGIPVCLHVRFRSREERLLLRQIAGARRRSADGARQSVLIAAEQRPNPGDALGVVATTLGELLSSGLFDVLPDLRFGLIETWTSWIPRILDALDDMYQRNLWPSSRKPAEIPSSYWERNLVASFISDPPLMGTYDRLGIDSVMWSTDFPHSGTFWPQSDEEFERGMAALTREQRSAIQRDNAVRFFRLKGN